MPHFLLTATRVTALSALLTSAALPVAAQFYSAAGTTTSVGTYTSLTAAASTDIATPNTDDANSAPQSIGFSFRYDGQAFTQFVLNTNGFIRLGDMPPSAPDLFMTANSTMYPGGPFASTDPADVNLIAPFNADLQQGTSPTAYRVATTGTAPNRVCTIQWTNVADKLTPPIPYIGNAEFQVKLHETTNIIDFVYGPFVSSGTFVSFRTSIAGLKSTNGFVTVWKNSIDPFSNIAFESTNYAGASQGVHLNYRPTTLPEDGRTISFAPPAANDAGVLAVYSQGKIPQGVPHVVMARVVNAGTQALTALAVTLNVTGATNFTDAQTISSLAIGDTALVTFTAYTPTAATGANTVTVSVGPDATLANNTRTYTQELTADTYAYGTNTPANGPSLGGIAKIFVRYATPTAKVLNSARIYIGSGMPLVGQTVRAIYTDADGNTLTPSADLVIAATDLGTYHTFTFATPPAVPAGDFYVGIESVDPMQFYLGTQTESPVRTGAYFAVGSGNVIEFSAIRLALRPLIEATLGAAPNGLNNAALEQRISVYPNPAAGQASVRLQGTNAKHAVLTILDPLGRAVHTAAAADNATQVLDLRALANGLYTLRIALDEQIVTKRLVVQQ